MQQKVAIARALLTSPTLLLLDEPTTGLDPRSKLEVQRFIEEVRDDHDATILLTTHDMAEADRLCDRIAILDGGRLVIEDTPEGLKAQGGPGDRPAAHPRHRLHDLDGALPRRGRRGSLIGGRRMTRYDQIPAPVAAPFAAGRGRPHPPDPVPAHRREVSDMFVTTRVAFAVHAERAARFEAEARNARIAAEIRAARVRNQRTADRRIRRAIGRSIVRIGERIAADTAMDALKPAGSR